ncbi:hypothetical protein BDV10DRAFT_34519 [Aspergillus recurvatus]
MSPLSLRLPPMFCGFGSCNWSINDTLCYSDGQFRGYFLLLMISGVTIHSFMISDLSGDTPLAWEIMRRRTRLIPLAVYSLLCDLIAVAV